MPSISPPPSWRGPALVAAAAAAGPLALAAIGAARPGFAFAAAALTAILAATLAALAARWARGSAPNPERVSATDSPRPPFQASVEALPDPLLLVEASVDDEHAAAARIVFANAAARELLRIGEAGISLVTAIRRPEALEAIEESLFGGVVRSTPFEAGGSQDRIWRLSATRLPGEPGGPRIALVVLHDETDARRNERMRADFLANASHELRTPLASLTGFIETLRGHAREDTAARERFLGIMAAQAERMRRLIEDLLSLSRIELNEHIPPSGACELSMAVGDVIDALGPLADGGRVRLDLRLPPRGAATVLGDRDQILQVIQNLLDNALKYSPPGGAVTVEVTSDLTLDQAVAPDPSSPRLGAENGGRLSVVAPDRTVAGERYAALRIADDGPGMDREHLPRLSARFYRIEGQKSGERAGTGLGLAIVKHIVIRHRGGLVVESAPGRGTCFTAYFPLRAAGLPSEAETGRPAHAEASFS